MRPVLALVAAALVWFACVAPAIGQVRLARSSSAVHALSADARGRALAVVDSGDRERPFALIASQGSGRSILGTFGVADAEFPDVSAGFVGWARPISGGAELSVAPVDALRSGEVAAFATGPGRLAELGGVPLVAYPDEVGDAAVAVGGEARALSADAPERRHLPLDLAANERGGYVLDLVQRRSATELRVLGPGAPGSPVVALRGLRHVGAALAVSENLVAVAYFSAGRARLATARPGGGWSRRRLPGPGGGMGAPAVAIEGSRVVVAYPQRVDGDRELFVATSALRGRVRAEQLTVARGDDRDPHLAAAPNGELFVAWTRHTRRPTRQTPFLEPLS